MQVFENQEFGQLGVLMLGSKAYFPASDCAKLLGYMNPNAAVIRHCKGILKRDTPSAGGVQSINFIPEGDLYRLIIRSKLSAAVRFESWVFDEVLPTIRKHGAYINEDVLYRMQEDSEYNAELLRNLAAERNRSTALANKVAVLTPKAHYHDIVMQYPDAIPITLIAGDYGMTANAFNKLLHSLRIQRKVGGVWVLYKEHQGYGYTVTHTCTRNGIVVWMHTYWRQKGRRWLYDALKPYGIVPVVEREAIQVQMSLFSVM
jgi:prophage antirepressor-like protein